MRPAVCWTPSLTLTVIFMILISSSVYLFRHSCWRSMKVYSFHYFRSTVLIVYSALSSEIVSSSSSVLPSLFRQMDLLAIVLFGASSLLKIGQLCSSRCSLMLHPLGAETAWSVRTSHAQVGPNIPCLKLCWLECVFLLTLLLCEQLPAVLLKLY
jgi:hypothetical protein